MEPRRKSHNRRVIKFAIELQQMPRLEQDELYGVLLSKRSRPGRIWEVTPAVIGAKPLIIGAADTARHRGQTGYDLLSRIIDD